MNGTRQLRYDEHAASIDVNAMIMDPSHEGMVLLPWGSAIPRVGETFEYEEEDGTRYLLVTLRYYPRAPTARMRRYFQRPDTWLRARLERVLEFHVEMAQMPLPFTNEASS